MGFFKNIKRLKTEADESTHINENHITAKSDLKTSTDTIATKESMIKEYNEMTHLITSSNLNISQYEIVKQKFFHIVTLFENMECDNFFKAISDLKYYLVNVM